MTRIEEIRERTAKATKGPWVVRRMNKFGKEYAISEIPGLGFRDNGTTSYDYLNSADHAFIAHCREDVPFLLSEVERLETEVAEQARLNGMGGEREADLLGKVARLEKQLSVADAALEAVEWCQTTVKFGGWSDDEGEIFHVCPLCGALKERKPEHFDYCEFVVWRKSKEESNG